MRIDPNTLIILKKSRHCNRCGKDHMDAEAVKDEDGAYWFDCVCNNTLFIPKHKEQEFVLHECEIERRAS